jgi:O-antigen/teichoic acid export membrane protein
MGGEKVVFLVRLIVLARLLAPEDFGLVAIGMAVLAIAISLTDFGVVAALIQQPASDKRHLDTAWSIGLLRGLSIVVVLAIAAPYIAEGFSEPRATDIIRALGLTALLQAASSIEIARLSRELRFGGLAGIRLAAAIVNTIVAVVLANGFGPWALVWGAVAGSATHMLLSYVIAPYRPAFVLADKATAGIARFGRWIFLVGVVAVATDAGLRWIIATRLGVVELGLYFMAVRLAFLPAQLISELVSEVAFPVYAELQEDRRRAAKTFRGLLVSVAALLVPVCLVFAWFVPDLVEHVLGERWQGAATVMQLLIVSSIVGLLGDNVGPVLKGSGNPAGIAAMDALQLALVIGLGWPLVGMYGLVGAGIAWLSAVAVSQLLAALYLRKLFERPFAGITIPLLAILSIAILATLVAALVEAKIAGALGVVAAIVLSAVAVVATTLAVDRRFELGILQTLSGPFPVLRRLTRASESET